MSCFYCYYLIFSFSPEFCFFYVILFLFFYFVCFIFCYSQNCCFFVCVAKFGLPKNKYPPFFVLLMSVLLFICFFCCVLPFVVLFLFILQIILVWIKIFFSLFFPLKHWSLSNILVKFCSFCAKFCGYVLKNADYFSTHVRMLPNLWILLFVYCFF